MGNVFLALETATGRTVAIKFLDSPWHGNLFERFRIEIRALADLKHPNIVSVLEAKLHGRYPYFTMEFADGGTLADLARGESPIAPSEAARLMLGVGEAVAAAHHAGILHRDLKPSNVLLRRSLSAAPGVFDSSAYEPLVSDFGLARRMDQESEERLTRTGALGTPAYMSPEAARGHFRDVTEASDVYGLGATLYHLITGRPPFSGDTEHDVITQVIRAPVHRPRSIRSDVPVGLEAIALKALEKEPAARYRSAQEFAEDLKRFLDGQSPVAPKMSPRRQATRWAKRNGKQLAAALGFALIAAAIGYAAMMPRPGPKATPAPASRDPEEVMREQLAIGQTVRLLDKDGLPRSATWPLQPSELTTSTDDGGTCSFQSREARFLVLLKDPGIERYRFRAEIRQTLQTSTVAGSGLDTVGIAVGYSVHPTLRNMRVHALHLLSFYEADPNVVNPRRRITLFDMGIVDAPLEARRLNTIHGIASIPPAPGPDGTAWRPLFLEVSPEGIRTLGKKGIELYSVQKIDRRRGEMTGLLNASSSGAFTGPLENWSPRMPLGIWSIGSSVSVRNAIIEPLNDH